MSTVAHKRPRSPRTKAKTSFGFLRVREPARRRIVDMADAHRMKLADAVEVLIDAWDRMSAEQRMDVLMPPVAACA